MSRQHSKIQLQDVYTNSELDIFAKFNSHKIGVIKSFDTAAQTAEIELVDIFVKENYDRKSGEASQPKYTALLVDCPVLVPCNNGKGITYPITAGDYCLVHFNDRDIDNWFAGANSSKPATPRMHHIADGIACVGIHNKANPIENYENNAVEVRFGESKISVAQKIKIENSAKSMATLLDKLILALTNLKVQDGTNELPVTAATITALNDIKAEFNELFE